jgi:large subunit ribosomal protein L22
MPEWGYSTTILDPTKTAKASGRELRVSPKHATEICKTIKGMKLQQAKTYLQQVIQKKAAIPFRKHKKKIPHRRDLQQKFYAGRYPVKAAQKILRILESAEANAEHKGLDTENLKITHTSAYPAMKIKRYKPRAFGRMTPHFETPCHIEVILQQIEAP